MNRDEPRLKVLIVEDEPGVAESIAYALEVEGFDVLTAATGRDGVNLAKKSNPAIVLLDLMLPESSGLDVCRQHDDWHATVRQTRSPAWSSGQTTMSPSPSR